MPSSGTNEHDDEVGGSEAASGSPAAVPRSTAPPSLSRSRRFMRSMSCGGMHASPKKNEFENTKGPLRESWASPRKRASLKTAAAWDCLHGGAVSADEIVHDVTARALDLDVLARPQR